MADDEKFQVDAERTIKRGLAACLALLLASPALADGVPGPPPPAYKPPTSLHPPLLYVPSPAVTGPQGPLVEDDRERQRRERKRREAAVTTPEPASVALLAVALAGLCGARRRRLDPKPNGGV